MAEISAGDQVLVRGVVTADGRQIILAPGVEIAMGSLDVVAPLPEDTDGLPIGLVFFFASDDEREDFARSFLMPSVGVDL